MLQQTKQTDLGEADLVGLYPKRKVGKLPKKKKTEKAFEKINAELSTDLDRWIYIYIRGVKKNATNSIG